MELLIQIIGFACFGHLGADFLQRYEWLWDKPFKCNMCLTAWSSLIPFIFIYGWIGILYASISAITSELIYRKLL